MMRGLKRLSAFFAVLFDSLDLAGLKPPELEPFWDLKSIVGIGAYVALTLFPLIKFFWKK